MKACFYSALSRLSSKVAISVVVLLIIGLMVPGVVSADVTSEKEQVVSASPETLEIDRSVTDTNSTVSTASTYNDVNTEATDPQVSNFWINDNRITDGEDVTVYVAGQAEATIYYDHTLEVIDETGFSDEVIAEESISLSESSFITDITVENLEQPGFGYGDERELSVRLTQESTTCLYGCGVSDRSGTQEYTIYDADSVDPDPSVEGVSDTFTSGINHESELYAFENGEPTETPTVTAGEEVTVQLYVRNEGGNAGDFSSIQMQFPDFDDEADGEFITHTYGTGEDSIYDVIEIEPGDAVYNADDTTSTASSWAVEWTDGRYGWLSDEVKLLEVTFELQETGTFSVYYRATLTDDVKQDGEHNKFTTPSWAVQDDPDQDGYDMYSFEIDVEPENEPPTADAGGPYSVLADNSIDLDASDSYDPDGGSVDVDWSLIDGPGSINGDTYSAPTSVSGDTSVTVEVEVTDSHGATDTDTATITVEERAAPNADAGGSYSVSEGESIELDASDSSAPDSEIVSTDWSLNDGPGSLSGDTYTAPSPISSDESVTVEVEVTDNYGKSDTDTATISIVSDAAPTADAGDSYNVDPGDSVSLDASGSAAPDSEIVDIEWTLDDGPGSLSGNTYTAPSDVSDDVTATVSATITDSNGATDTDSAIITIEAPDSPEADAGGPYLVEEGDSVTLDSSNSVASGGTIVDTAWTVITGPGSINSGTYHAPTSLSSDTSATVELEVTDSNGATATDTTTISIDALNPAVFDVSIMDTNSPVEAGEILQVTAEIENQGDVSESQTIELDVPGLGTDSTTIHSLDGGDSTTETLNVSTSSGDAGSYSATVVGGDDSDSRSVEIDPQTDTLSITSTLNDASVYLDGEYVGNTPWSEDRPVTESYEIKVDADGYEPEVRSDVSPPADEEFTLEQTTDGEIRAVDHPSVVAPDGSFTVAIDTDNTSSAVVEFASHGDASFDLELSSDDAVAIDGDRVEFLDPTTEGSTHEIDVDITGGQPADGGEIRVWVNAEDQADADDELMSTFELGDTHPSGVSQTVWDGVTDKNTPVNDLTFQDLDDTIQAYHDGTQVNGVDLAFQDLIDLIMWYQSDETATMTSAETLSAGVTPTADGTVTLTTNETVTPGGETTVSVETEVSAGTVVEFDPDGVSVALASEDAVSIDENRVEFLDANASSSTYEIDVDVDDGVGGDTVDIDAWVNAENRIDAEDTATATLEIVTEDESIVTGIITTVDGNPVENVDVEVVDPATDETEAVDTTDDDGSYSLELTPDQTYELVVEAEGFEPFTTEVTVETDRVHTEPIVLSPADENSEDDGAPRIEDYANDEGVVGADGVQDAFADWQAGEIESDLLQDVFGAWQSGSTIAD